MTCFSIERRERIFIEGYELLFFTKNMSKNIGKNVSKNSSYKYSSSLIAALQKRLDHAKQSGTDALKTDSSRAIQTAKATSDLISNFDPEQREQIIYDLILI